ncbi:PDZ domain-containing protein, partial [Salmonella enterica]|uniref:PDZ domain-containing protein n=1 Tax=Salmonella enterica TaxID=28901 RepID=UPI00352681FB
AKDRATYVALKAAGFPVSRKDGAAIVDYVICLQANEANTKCIEEPPAADVLQPNDVITSLDGKPVDSLDDLQPILATIEPGDTVPITLERDGDTIDTEVETILAPGE